MAYYKCGSVYTTQNSNVGINTASGDIASFQTNLAMALQKLKIAFSASQDLHGYSKPWIGGAGKNKLPNLTSTVTSRTVTFTPQTDGKIRVNGTAQGGNAVCDVGRDTLVLPSGSYFVNESNSTYTVTVFKIVGGTATVIKSGGGAFTLTETTSVFVRLAIPQNSTVTNLDVALQLESGSSPTSFEPYENICPITGFSQANVVRCGKNLFNKATATVGKYINPNNQEITNALKTHSDIIKVKPSGTYYTSGYGGANIYSVLALDENKKPIASYYGGASKSAPFTFTLTSAVHYVILNFNTDQLDSVIFTESASSVPYEPYHGNTYLIPFGDTYYGCEIDVVHGKLRVVKSVYTVLGTETVQNFLAGTNNNGYRVAVNLPHSSPTTYSGLRSSALTNAAVMNSATWNINNFCVYNDKLYMTVPNVCNTQNLALDYVTGMQFEYELATPIEVDIDSAIITALTGEVNQVYCDIPNSNVDLEYKVVNL